MFTPSPNQEQQEFESSINNHQVSVFWQRDLNRKNWELEASEEIPPPAPNWFFLTNHQRTGSSVTVHLLKLHPEIYCGREEQTLPFFMSVLGAERLITPFHDCPVRYRKSIEITPVNMRNLMEAWRRCTSGRPIFGDKGDLYYTHFGEACEKVFPGCKLLLTVRHPLDTLSSYLKQPWNSYLYRVYTEPEKFLRFLRSQALTMLKKNNAWRERAQVIVFEEMAVRELYAETFRRVLEHLGADPEVFDWEAGWKLCDHQMAIGRWRNDPQMETFVDWLDREDPPLREILTHGEYYLPETYVEAEQEPLSQPAVARAT